MLDEIQAALNEQLQNKTAFEIPLFGGIPVPASAVVTWVIILLLTLLAIWLTHDLKRTAGQAAGGGRDVCWVHQQFLSGNLGGKNIGVPLRLILVPSACIFCLRTYPGCLGWHRPPKI